jgi:hypothetical protein
MLARAKRLLPLTLGGLRGEHSLLSRWPSSVSTRSGFWPTLSGRSLVLYSQRRRRLLVRWCPRLARALLLLTRRHPQLARRHPLLARANIILTRQRPLLARALLLITRRAFSLLATSIAAPASSTRMPASSTRTRASSTHTRASSLRRRTPGNSPGVAAQRAPVFILSICVLLINY